MWTKCLQGFSLEKMYFIPPTSGERFYLRTLLTIMCRPKSFTDLRSFNNIQYTTFRDACQAQGLLKNNGKWKLCLREAAQVQTGHSLRWLFATMLLFCQISHSKQLWQQFCTDICNNLVHHIPSPTINHVHGYGLFLINQLLGNSSYSLDQFPNMPTFHSDWAHLNKNHLINEKLLGFWASQRKGTRLAVYGQNNSHLELFLTRLVEWV